MSIERRSILKGAAAFACGGGLSPASAASPDPLIALIRVYQIGTAEFKARSASENWDDLTVATYGPSLDRLCTCPPMPTSFAGAVAGIEFVLSEMADFVDSDANEAVLKVCAAFLRQYAGASA